MKLPSRLCCEERLLRARRGQLTASEWGEHSDHLAVCADCRTDWLLARDFDQSAAVRPGDEQLLAAATKVALAATRTTWARLSRVAVAAAVLLTAGAAAGGAVVWHFHSTAAHSRSKRELEVNRSSLKVSRPTSVWEAPAQVPAAEDLAPSVEVPLVTPVRVPRPKSQANRPLAFVQPVPSPTPVVDDGLDPPTASETAHGLLNQAMSERRQGHRQPAILALRSLRRQFPDSPEAVVALVSLGNLLLDVHEPAEALPLFQQYYEESPSGALAPEAMAGQARTLEQLQRSVDAKAMWQELLRRFPGSPYARSKLLLDLEGSHP